MADSISLNTETRTEIGTRASTALRKKGLVPATIYGHKEKPQSVSVKVAELLPVIRHHTRSLELVIAGGKETVLLKELQYDHLGDNILHVDFQRVSATERIHTTVTIELRGIAVGTNSGGVLDQPLHTLHIECLALAVPESIRVRIDDLKLGDAIHVRELTLPEGVKALVNGDAVVVQVKAPDAEVVADTTDAGTAEPEVITARKKEDEEEK